MNDTGSFDDGLNAKRDSIRDRLNDLDDFVDAQTELNAANHKVIEGLIRSLERADEMMVQLHERIDLLERGAK